MKEQIIKLTAGPNDSDRQKIEFNRIRRGTYGAARVLFDFSEIADIYGDAESIELWFKASNGTFHKVPLEINGTIAAWNISAEDTAVPGRGECELFYSTPGNSLWKSEIFDISILRDIG